MSKRPVTVEDLLCFILVGDPQISPNGQEIVFAQKVVNEKNKTVSNLFKVSTSGGAPVQLTQGEGGAGGARWSPDGKSISFVSGRNKPGSQIYLLPSLGEAIQLTKLPEGTIGETKWSPDGTKIAFTYRETHPNHTEKAASKRKENGLSDPPLEIDDIWYRLDGDGYFLGQRFSIWILDVHEKTTRQLYSDDAVGNYSFDWSPASDELVVAHSASRFPFREKPNIQLYRVKLDGSASQIPGLPTGDKSAVLWSPNGEWIVYSGDVDENDPWGTRNDKLYRVRPDGTDFRDLTGHQDFDLEVATLSDTKEAAFGAVLAWSPDSKFVFAQIGTRGESQVGRIDVENGGIEVLTQGKHLLGMGNVAQDGRVAALWGDPTHIPEIAVVEGSTHRVLTAFNKAVEQELNLLAPEEIEWTSADGHKVHGWVIKPANFDPTKKYPAVLEVHGGPHTQYGWTFFHEFQVLAAEGYVVVYSNPRGSKGYGEDHCAAIRGDWGNKDWIDVQAVLEWMKSTAYIDAKKLGIMGGSYGGYMTNWAIGHTHDFCAAITDRCVSNMVSMAGNSDFPFNKDGYFRGVAYGDLEKIRDLWAQSPIAYFENVKTPTLVIHSEGDLRCNIEQGEQVFHALQQQGIESRFVRYPRSTFHGMSRNGPADLRIHRLREITAWWKRFF